MKNVLLIPHIKIQNANALSSPFTVGFPAMTAWLGAAHALQRKINEKFERRGESRVQFTGTGVISHSFKLQAYKGPGDYEYSIIGTSNPLDKDGQRPSFIEEVRCNLEVSLIIEYEGVKKLDEDEFIDSLDSILSSHMKIAGGDILGFLKLKIIKDFELLRKFVMPGYALIERRDLMLKAMEEGMDALDAIIDYLAIHHSCEKTGEGPEASVTWHSSRKRTGSQDERGWIVPIATGFQGLSEPGPAKNQRDPETPHLFAEAIVTLGEFIMPYKNEINNLDKLLWRYSYDKENCLYLCQQKDEDSMQTFSEDEF
ncbi:type I-F CRISPR-associated protein Csy2 [Marispirochaeta sp.]|uniref:type I-F CRISPR-associated protein Csy2 n=1 Tax=Marispirochaeta sp. TaxID=2038653 RepID=UPI0029C75A05|nr:type I-F CRISPR-associated protein Csy2 [Marispirochaeta sp.]